MPERHALTFAGWNDLPDAMPAHDVVVAGTYKPSDGIYVGVNSDFDGAEGDLPIEVDGKAENEALGQFKRAIVVSGGRIEVNGRKKQITRVDISPFVSDGVVVDREGLAGAIKNLYNATVTKKNDTFRLIVDHTLFMKASNFAKRKALISFLLSAAAVPSTPQRPSVTG